MVEIEAADDPAASLPRPPGPARRLFEPPHAFEYFADDDVVYLAEEGCVARCDAAAGTARVAVRTTDPRAAFLASHLMLSLPLLELLKRRGRYAVHAAGAAVGGRAALFAGPAGAGKSTLALACVRDGLAFLGDDVLFLEDAGGGLTVHAFPDEIDVADPTLAFFPDLARALAGTPSPAGWPKRPVQPERHGALEIAWESEPAVLLFPRVAEATALSPVSAADALVALVPNVIRTETAASQRHLDALGALARSCPAFRLEVGDPRQVPPLLRELLGGRD